MGPEAGQSDMQPNFPPSRLQGQLVQAPVPLARGRCQKLVSRPLGATYHRDNGHGEQGVWQVDLGVSGPGLTAAYLALVSTTWMLGRRANSESDQYCPVTVPTTTNLSFGTCWHACQTQPR